MARREIIKLNSPFYQTCHFALQGFKLESILAHLVSMIFIVEYDQNDCSCKQSVIYTRNISRYKTQGNERIIIGEEEVDYLSNSKHFGQKGVFTK